MPALLVLLKIDVTAEKGNIVLEIIGALKLLHDFHNRFIEFFTFKRNDRNDALIY